MTVVTVTVSPRKWINYLDDVIEGIWKAHHLSERQVTVPSGRLRTVCGLDLPAWRAQELPDITEPGSRSMEICEGCL